MAEVKITKKDKFLEIQDVLENAGHADLAAFIGDQVASLDKKQNFPPYKFEIAMIKSGVFDEQLIEKIRNQ